MLTDMKDLSSVKKAIEVEVPADAVAREIETVTGEFGRKAKVPGFRPGKVPSTVIRKRFLTDIREEVVQRLLPRFFHDALAEKGMVAVGSPDVRRVDPLLEGAPLKFEVEFEIKPQFEVKNWRGLELELADATVTEDEVTAMIERLRDQASTFRPVEGRGAEDGDYVVMNIDTSGEGVEPRHSESAQIQLGEESPLPELHEALQGKRPGDQAVVEKRHGEDAANEEIRGKTVRYDIVIRELRTRERPDVTDEMARSFGWESIAEMRERISEDLRGHKEHESLRARREEAANKLVEMHYFELPQSLVDEELGSSLRNYARYLASQGVDVENAEIDWQRLQREFLPDAEKRTRRGLILDAIGREEKITITDAEVDAEIRRAAEGSAKEFAEVKQRLRKGGGYEQLRMTMMQEKALDSVVSEARLVPAAGVAP